MTASMLPLLVCKVYPTEAGYGAYYGDYSGFGATEEAAVRALRVKVLAKLATPEAWPRG